MRLRVPAHIWLVALAFASVMTVSRPAAADDRHDCLNGSKETAAATIAACTRAIQSGDYEDQDLSSLYHGRGYAWSWTGNADRADRAFKDYSEAIRINPKAAGSLLNRAQLYNQRHDYDHTIADVNQAFEGDLSDYGKRVGYKERGYAYHAKGDNDRAIADYTDSIELDGNDRIALADRGNAYFAKGDLDRATADYDKAIELDPKDAAAYYRRSFASKAKGDLDRVIADCSQAIALYPYYRDAWFTRALTYQTKGDLDRAIADYSQMIALDPNDTDAYVNRAYAYLQKGDFRHFIADLAEGQALSCLVTVVFLTVCVWLCCRPLWSRRRMTEMCEKQVAEIQHRNAALEKIALALESRCSS